MKTFNYIFVFLFAVTTMTAQSTAIKVEVNGTGDPVLFLPGFTNPGSIFKSTAANLSSKGQHHFVSYAGFNNIPTIEMPWYDTLRADLLTYIDNNALHNLTIISHSMGGNLAVDLAAARPDAVKNMVLIDALPCMRAVMMPGVPATQLQYDSPYNNQMLSLSEEQFKQSVTFMAKNMTNKEDKVDTLLQWMLEADRKTYVYGYTDLLKLDLRPKLTTIKAKTLILGATFPSLEMAKNTLETQYANLKNKNIVMVPNSKHFIMFDQPEVLYAKINAFLTNDQF
ncbi:alpha/beta fold hydrolase [Aquimarina brevivitae]|uniref:Pimeloyl-ACP methyl ester carboxylesterase n=1 Tax=Aquimarina brevivitae TaxID=323412 RepID=A0A4Q7P3C6_9FLAO|nr:alpha/beta hydrolase [Aquimarina brevivitae]RZS93182.1 pimeloyl-ACP methyl ester carboxylesterase [Aquimarina brevivitae]